MRAGWLLRDGEVLAAVELVESTLSRYRGFIGRPMPESALLLPRTRSVHTFGVSRTLDVAFLTDELAVVATTTLRPWRVAFPRRGCRTILEAPAGWFERWALRPGDLLEFHPTNSERPT